MKPIGILLGALAVSLTATSAFAIDIDSRYQPYQQTSGVSGSLKSIGSDTLNNLMTLWSEGFRAKYPTVKIEVEGKGSSTAPPALIAGTSQLGPMSREMKSAEIDSFEQKFGYKPTQVRVAVDALAVFIHKDNPLTCLTLTQIDGMFSKGRLSGSPAITTWGQLGLKGEWADKPISLFGRNSASGTYGYFKEVTMLNGDYSDSVKEQPGSSAVVQGVAADKYAIGYSGIGYKTADVKAVDIADRNGQCQAANQQNAYTGAYSIARFLYIYVNKNPSEALSPLLGEFFSFVLSKDGQQDTSKDGYFPMPYVYANQERAKLGLN